jgi:hypothetical protein
MICLIKGQYRVKVNDFKKVVAQEEEVDPTSEGPSDGWCGRSMEVSEICRRPDKLKANQLTTSSQEIKIIP